ncbi:EAL domain-containing protein [Noviherbaspirillum sp. UKPF54]|uniref:sensor domain-containing protein n=1 Tax=Noviherbaspirillum sp. UKPF54 TaxID=2601898 RepID=UPI00143D1177|nr:EAL domain-containing protein [Noviherbaspirillum sp. UKPF54]
MSQLGALCEEADLAALINASPFPYLLLSTDFVILGANDAYLCLTGRARDEIVGRGLFDAFPADPDTLAASGHSIIQASLERALATGRPDHLAVVRYNIPRRTADGKCVFEERYWSLIHTPVPSAQGGVALLFQNPIDVTELVRLQQAGGRLPACDDIGYQIAGSVFSRAQALQSANRLLDREREHLLHLFRQAPGFVAVTRGPQHVLDIANESFRQLVGQREVLGKPVVEALPEVVGQGYDRLLDQVYTTGEAFVGHQMKAMFQQRADAPLSERYVDFVFQPFTDLDGKTAGIFIQGQDVTEHVLAQEALRISNERWKLAVEGSGDGVWDWNMLTGEVVFSRRFREMFGYGEQDFPNSIETWKMRVHPDDLNGALNAVRAAVRAGMPVMFEFRFLCGDGKWKWARARGIVVGHEDSDKPSRMTGTVTDISQKKESDELIWRQANFDALTGLPNRRLFRDRLDQEVRKAPRSPHTMSLMFIDLDRFKEVNDLLGHDAGDRLLVEAAQRLTACVRKSDTVARLGGDEFTVILTELVDMAHVEDVAQKILRALARPFFINQQTVYISGSVGITMFEADASTAEQLITNADQAMYAAKHAGRNQFRYFTPSMQERAQRRLRLANDLRDALAVGQLEVHYQPVVELATGRIVKAEALLRWNHPALGLVPPAQFIPIAEETGLINEIGDWVFRQAAGCSRQWQSQLGKTVQVSVNASPIQFHAAEQGVGWLKYLDMLGLLGGAVAVEISEGLLLNASPAVAERLLAYRDAGIQVAIDDFGTGYSSMQYLKKFDIDYLKIDQSFVREMVASASDRTIVKSIIVMAHELGLQAVAEGIETPEQRDMLLRAGCDYGQGFLFSQALAADAFASLMAEAA